MKSTKAAARYSKALLDLAVEQNLVDRVADDMNYILEVDSQTRDFQVVLNSPVISASKKLEIFSQIFTSFDESTKKFIELITKNRREYMLVQIASSFKSQVNAMRGIVPVTLVSAVSMSDDTKKEILQKVEQAVGGKIEVTEQLDESLIGGFIVKMEDKQFDASVSRQLSNLKQLLTR